MGNRGPSELRRQAVARSAYRRRLWRSSAATLTAQPDQDATGLAFPSEARGPLDPGNLRRRVLKPLAEEVNAPWAGFHTFRHTFASLHLSQGTNLLQLSRALGHHSPAFTMTHYTHLLPAYSK